MTKRARQRKRGRARVKRAADGFVWTKDRVEAIQPPADAAEIDFERNE